MIKMKTLRFPEKKQGMTLLVHQEEGGDPHQVLKEAEVVILLEEMTTTSGIAMVSFTVVADEAATTLLHQEGEGREETNSGM